MEEPFGAPVRKKRNSRFWLLLGCGTVAGLFVVCGLACGLGYLFFGHGVEEQVTDADREIALTLDAIELPDDFDLDPSAGTLRRLRYLDGSRDIEYEYETPEGAEDELYLNSSVSIEKNPSDAHSVYLGMYGGLKIGMRLAGGRELRMEEADRLLRWGEESKCYLLKNGDLPVGNCFIGRKGSRVFYLCLVGLYYDDSTFNELVSPVLKRVEAYRP